MIDGNCPTKLSQEKPILGICGRHESIGPQVRTSIHLNEKCASNVKKLTMSSFGYVVRLGSKWASGTKCGASLGQVQEYV